ncbi:MAG TPA: hypothetical protein VMR23_09605, partial [Candidatus Limnocylindria bacterium]|nr:hypothetical protein [Candidatus Limnocylindria bacterium]
ALSIWLPDDEPQRAITARAVTNELAALAFAGTHAGLLINEIDGVPAHEHPLAAHLVESGFAASTMGFTISRRTVGRA